jgi:hypothetical protein
VSPFISGVSLLPYPMAYAEHRGAIVLSKTSDKRHHSGDVPLNTKNVPLHLSAVHSYTNACSDPMIKQPPLRGRQPIHTRATPAPGIVVALVRIQGAPADSGKSRFSVPRAAYPRVDADWRNRTVSQGGGVAPRLVGLVWCTGLHVWACDTVQDTFVWRICRRVQSPLP